jgi:hypothetical protein
MTAQEREVHPPTKKNPRKISAPVPSTFLRLTTISPDAARTLLARPHPRARRRDEAVETYIRAMREGCWVLNGMPIVLSQSRMLLDGVQRLLACSESGIPLQTFVAENIEDVAFASIDQHQRRTFSGVLKSLGYGHPQLLAHLLFQLARYDDGILPSTSLPTMSWVRMLRILTQQPGIRQALTSAVAMKSTPLPFSIRIVVAFMGSQANPALTTRLLDALQYPARYPEQEPGALLHAESQRARTGKTEARSTAFLLALAIKALNAMQRGEEIRRLIWLEHASGQRPAEPFPILEGYEGLAGLGISDPATKADESSVSWQLESISPESAARYLETGRPGRAPHAAQVRALSEDIKLGRWQINAQPICFSSKGVLLNGLNRLQAILLAQRPIEAIVIHGLPEEAVASYDMAVRREASSGTQAAFGDLALATAMANLLWRFEIRPLDAHHKRASVAEVRAILQQHPRLMELRGFARKMVEYGRSSVMGYGAYVMERDDPQLARVFLQALSTGADLSAGHPILALRLTLQRLRRENASQAEQLNALIAGWKRYKTHPLADVHHRPGQYP